MATKALKVSAHVAATNPFDGFTLNDFAIFCVPGFAERMAELRRCVKPKLQALGAALAPRLSDTVGQPLCLHVAQHMRRTVNPPEETWAAFSPSPKAYKPFTHLRVAISETGVRVLLFLEDDAPAKLVFAAGLGRNAAELAKYFRSRPEIQAFSLRTTDGAPLRGEQITAEVIRAFASRLEHIKGQHASFGIAFAADVVSSWDGPTFLDRAHAACATLRPLYDCGTKPGFTYTCDDRADAGR